MKVEKHFATLVLCLVVLGASRFAPYSCEALRDFHVEAASHWFAITGAGMLLIAFLYLPAYDVVAFLTYRLGWEASFDHLDVYPEDAPATAPPISLTTKLLLLYPLDVAAVSFFLLPLWTKCAYCS